MLSSSVYATAGPAMILQLRIQNFAILERVELEFTSGLTVLTGETGAGKSILVDALCRILGARASVDDVRAASDKAVLEALFDTSRLPEPALRLLEDWHIDISDGDLILRREIVSSGKSRALINNCTVTLQQLRMLSPYLVDLFGQNEHQTLLDLDSQRSLYDAAIGAVDTVTRLKTLASEIRELQQQWHSLREREQQRQRQIDILRYQIREIEETNVSTGEEQELLERKRLLQNSERVHSLCELLLQTVLEKDDNVSAQLQSVSRAIAEIDRYKSGFSAYSSKLEEWQEQLRDLIQQIDTLRASLDFEEGSLDALESRLEQLQKLKKKYGPNMEDVIASLDGFRGELAELVNAEDLEEDLNHRVQKLSAEYMRVAAAVTEKRASGKRAFEEAVERELKQVAMEKCGFRMLFPPSISEEVSDPMVRQYPAHGLEDIEFQIEPNPGEGFRALNRIASGGELSRLMLALKVVAQGGGESRALIFDEVDAGIGGRAAHQVGERLKALSLASQVLCVTHLPQVAVFGDVHFNVCKQFLSDRTITIVLRLEGEDRIGELARMLSGTEITQSALEHARQLREQVCRGAV